jgi:hypothetical protein
MYTSPGLLHLQKAFLFAVLRVHQYLSSMFRRIPIELIIWTTGLLLLAISETGEHFSLCPLKNVGWNFCPGCGLGRSISQIFDGHFEASLKTHPLGIFALIILSFRIVNLTKLYIQSYGKSY